MRDGGGREKSPTEEGPEEGGVRGLRLIRMLLGSDGPQNSLGPARYKKKSLCREDGNHQVKEVKGTYT